MKHYFKFSRKIKIITFSVIMLLIYVTIRVLNEYSLSCFSILCVSACWIPCLIAMSLTPICYIQKDDEIILCLLCLKIHYRMERYKLDYCTISSGRLIRLFGSGGFFGVLGWFSHQDIGKFLLFSAGTGNEYIKLTDRHTNKIILIDRSN